MASLAEMERELTVERTLDELDVARQLGRKPKMTERAWTILSCHSKGFP
jgi:DNA invertase Pin-like site-specific DNA recombinase